MTQRMPIETAVSFFSEFYGGPHHFPHKVREWGNGWSMLHHSDLSTYDFSQLTRLAFMAHDRCVRVEVSHVNPQYLRIVLHLRRRGPGRMHETHPTLEEAVAAWRENHPAPEPPQGSEEAT